MTVTQVVGMEEPMWCEATQHPEWRNLVGEACLGCNLDAQQCPMHLPYKNALIGKYSKILVMVSYRVIARIAYVYAFDVVCLK